MIDSLALRRSLLIFLKAGLAIIFFLITANKLANFPIDKAVMFLFIGLVMLHNLLNGKDFSAAALKALAGMVVFIMLSFLLNLPNSTFIVFFPVIGLLFAALISKEEEFLTLIYWGLFIHMLFGIYFVISSYMGNINLHVHPMYDKGLPFLHAAKGFTSTVQSFGTLVIAWILIYYWKKDNGQINWVDKAAYIIALLALLVTFNRNSILIFYLIMFFKQKKVFFSILILLLVFYLYFFEFINSLIFNVSTITSRSDLLQAFKIAFFEKAGWLEYFIGHGRNIVPDEIAYRTFYGTGYIENGTSVLLYTYGFFGFLFYLIAVITLAVFFAVKRLFFMAIMVGYILIVAQQFTHEFFATTLYILVAVFLIILNQSSKSEAQNRILSSPE